jgi:hypothetical protein
MKRYLFMGGLVLSLGTGAYANNPFDIAKNMQKIEAEDTMLLDTLEEETTKKGDIKSDDFVVSKHVKEQQVEPTEETMPQDIEPVVVEEEEAPIKQETPQKPINQTASKEIKKVENISVKIDKEPVQTQEMQESKAKEVVQEQNQVEPQKAVVKKVPIPKKVVKKQESLKIEDKKPKLSSIADINLTKEKEEATLRAKKELEEAIKEVDMED